jgi:type VI secretion system secreted protein VgrG
MASVFSFDCAPLPAETRVVGFLGEEGISALYRFEVWLAVPDAASDAVDLDALIGLRVTLRAHAVDGSLRRSTHGVVIEAAWDEGSLLRVTLAPKLWLATLDRHSKVYVDKSFREVLDATLQAAGLAPDDDFVLRLDQRYRPILHVCQYRESHYDFAQRWMEQMGVCYWFEHDGEREKLIISDTKEHHPRVEGGPVRYFASGETDRSVPDALWTYTQRGAAVTADARVRDYNYLTPTVDIDRDAPLSVRSEGKSVWHTEDDVTNPAEAARAARLRAEERVSSHERFRSRGRVFTLTSGFRFELEDHPRAALNQEYLVVTLRHRANVLAAEDGSPALRALLGPDVYRVEVESIRGSTQYRPPRVTPLPRVEGIEVGFVDGPADSPYAQIDAHGRYKVRLHLDERPNPAAGASTWVRMLQPHAGAPEGWHFPLRKGTEVMISFLGGDPDRPVIAGSIPDADHPSVVTSANHTHNVIHTGSDNRVEMEDLAGAQYVDISTPPQSTFLHLGAHHGSHAHNAIASTEGNGLVHQGGNQDIEVGGHKTEDVTGSVREKYDNTHTVTVKQDVTEIFHATQTTVVDVHNQEDYGTHTTEVTGHKIERCASQYTEVAGLLDEHHGTQSTTIDGLFRTTCATRTLRVANTDAEFYDSMDVTVGAGGWTVSDTSYLFFDAPNYTIMAPEVTETEIVRTEMTQGSWKTVKGEKQSKDQVKLSLIAAQISMAMGKIDTIGLAVGVTAAKASFHVYKRDCSVLKIEAKPNTNTITGFTGVMAALKAWL